MSGDSGKLFVNMDVDMSGFDSSIDKMNEKLKELKRAFASAERELDSSYRNLSSTTASGVIRKALSGVSFESAESTEKSYDTQGISMDFSQKNENDYTMEGQSTKSVIKPQDIETLIKREVENEFARQASKLSRI